MLDIQGQTQPTPAPASAVPAAPAKPGAVPAIPSISDAAVRITEWTAVLAVVMVIATGAYLSFVLSQRQSLIATQNREVDAIKTQLGTPERVKTEALVNQFTAGLTAIQSALAAPSPWSALLKDLTQRMPNGAVITNLSTADNLTFRVSGTADTYQDVSHLLAALSASNVFKQITLESAMLSDTTSGAAVAFSLKATYVPTKQPSATTSVEADGQQ